jgi:hypothetical protein
LELKDPVTRFNAKNHENPTKCMHDHEVTMNLQTSWLKQAPTVLFPYLKINFRNNNVMDVKMK